MESWSELHIWLLFEPFRGVDVLRQLASLTFAPIPTLNSQELVSLSSRGVMTWPNVQAGREPSQKKFLGGRTQNASYVMSRWHAWAVKWCVVDATASLVAKACSTTCVATNCSEGCVVNTAQHSGFTRNWCACIPYVNQVVPETKHRNVLGSENSEQTAHSDPQQQLWLRFQPKVVAHYIKWPQYDFRCTFLRTMQL